MPNWKQLMDEIKAEGNTIIEEFERAKIEIAGIENEDPTKSIPPNPGLIPIWQPIIAKYEPTLIGECEKAIAWSEEIVIDWLKTGMFLNDTDISVTEKKIQRIIEELGSHAITKSHDRHISISKAKEIELKIVELEKHNDLQEAVLTVHHACMQSLAQTNIIKIIQNQNGTTFIQTIQYNN